MPLVSLWRDGVTGVTPRRAAPGTLGVWAKIECYVPPGWSYDPSDWSQRLPIVRPAMIGLAMDELLASPQHVKPAS